MKLGMALAACVALLIGCGADHGRAHESVAAETENVAHETFALGSAVTSRGAVPHDAEGETFTRGDEVYLSVNVTGVSTDPVVEVKWLDPYGATIRRDVRHVQQGTTYVPFSSGETTRWTRGAHSAVVLIDGRRVSEKRFDLM